MAKNKWSPKALWRRLRRRDTVVAVVRLSGVISHAGGPMRNALNLDAMGDPLETAFTGKRHVAVVLLINSPGGSPVQSALLHDRIRQLAEKEDKPVFCFCEDVAASGGYWLACAGDEIFANENSIVGSIGVIAASFGFEDLIAKIGIQRRLHTSGQQKSFLDPFLPETTEDVDRLLALQGDIHETFKAHVRNRRGARLTGDQDELFSGAFWTARQAKEFGLIDGFGDHHSVMRERYGEEVQFRDIGVPRSWLKRRLGVALGQSPGGWTGGTNALTDGLLGAIAENSYWKRFGL